MRHNEVERRHQFPHPVRSRLHRLFRAQFLGRRALYKALSMPVSATPTMLAAAAAAGAAAGVAITWHNRSTKAAAKAAHEKVTVQELKREDK